jgi:hypothetical protein
MFNKINTKLNNKGKKTSGQKNNNGQQEKDKEKKQGKLDIWI